jgi:hypothetical protein
MRGSYARAPTKNDDRDMRRLPLIARSLACHRRTCSVTAERDWRNRQQYGNELPKFSKRCNSWKRYLDKCRELYIGTEKGPMRRKNEAAGSLINLCRAPSVQHSQALPFCEFGTEETSRCDLPRLRNAKASSTNLTLVSNSSFPSFPGLKGLRSSASTTLGTVVFPCSS